jgi:fimbrial isopeptide formation D2 family protein/LPXTG-motif cell wall-anchored protein
MKHIRKAISIIIAMFMCLTMGNVALAQTVGTSANNKGSITINNAAKGETYSVVKVFGATLTDDATASSDATGIAYTGVIPEELKDYFKNDSTGNIIRTTEVSEENDKALISAIQNWAANQTPTASVESDGTTLTFTGLDYGLYAVISTQGTTVTIDSLKPNATINDKNKKDIVVNKTVGKDSYSIGDTINYTATFDTVNYYGSGENAKQVIKYTITDTLPAFLTDVVIDSITITKKDGTTTDPNGTINITSFTDGSIVIDWADEVTPATNPKTYINKYDNGAKIIVEYHGTLTSNSNINAANTNTVKIQPTVVNPDGTTEKPWDDSWQKDAVIYTYGAALKKTDENSSPLAGAEFTVAGLVVEAVKNADNTEEPGVYRVVSYDSNSTTPSAAMKTNADGKLYIIGLAKNAKLAVTETKAPDGYNKLTDPVELSAQVLTKTIYETSGTRYYDAKGNLVSESASEKTTEEVEKNYTELDAAAAIVVNNKGTELPSTGGIGTTIFYIVGGVMVAGAVVFLLTKRRMAGNE